MRILARLFTPFLLAGAVVLAVPTVAFADILVNDDAKVLDVEAVEAAGNRIDDANVYVTTFSEPGSGTDGVKNQLQDLGTATGADGSGGWLDNALVIGLYPSDVRGESRIDVFYGNNLNAKLDRTYLSVIDDQMIPEFGGSGDERWTNGIVAGLTEFESILGSNSSGSSGGSRATIWIVVGGIVLVLVVFYFLGRRKRAKAAAAEKERLHNLVLDNQFQAMQLRQRLDQAKILVGTIRDTPAQDVVEADVADVDGVLNRRDEAGNLEADPDQDHANLATLFAALESIATRVAVLRKDTGWQNMWTGEVATVRQAWAQLMANAQAVRGAKPELQLDITPVDAPLSALQASVLDGSTPIDIGVQSLGEISRGVKNQADVVNGHMAAIAEERRQAEIARAKQAEIDAQNNYRGGGSGSGGFLGGMLGGAIGSSMGSRSRSRGSGWGGGGFGGGRSSGGRSSGGRSSGGGRRGGGGGRSF